MRRFIAIAAGLAVIGTSIAAPAAQARPHRANQSGWQGWAFERTATYPVYLNNGDEAQQTVSEISAVSRDGRTLIYTDSANKQVGFVDITDPDSPRGLGVLALTRPGDADDEPTSVAVHGDYALIVINTSESHSNPPAGSTSSSSPTAS